MQIASSDVNAAAYRFQWPPRLRKDSAKSTTAQVVKTYSPRATVNKERLKLVVFFMITSNCLWFFIYVKSHILRVNYTGMYIYVNIVLYIYKYF